MDAGTKLVMNVLGEKNSHLYNQIFNLVVADSAYLDGKLPTNLLGMSWALIPLSSDSSFDKPLRGLKCYSYDTLLTFKTTSLEHLVTSHRL